MLKGLADASAEDSGMLIRLAQTNLTAEPALATDAAGKNGDTIESK